MLMTLRYFWQIVSFISISFTRFKTFFPLILLFLTLMLLLIYVCVCVCVYIYIYLYLCMLSLFSCVRLFATLLDCSPPGSSVYGFIQARILYCLSCLQCRRHGFDPWVRKIPWRRTWLPTPVFLSGESHGQRILAGYSPQGHKEPGMNKRLTVSLSYMSLLFLF